MMINKSKQKSGKQKSGKKICPKFCAKILSKFFALVTLVIFTPVLYFLLVISAEYKSFPIITKQIEKTINKNINIPGYIKIKKTYLKFSSAHKIKTKVTEISYQDVNQNEIKLPRSEIEFSILNLLIGRFAPTKLTIFSPEIEISVKNKKMDLLIDGLDFNKVTDQKDNIFSDKNTLDNQAQQQIIKIYNFFDKIKSEEIPIQDIAIINGKFTINDRLLILKKAHFYGTKKRTVSGREFVNFKSDIAIDLEENKPNFNISSNCDFDFELDCNVNFNNFSIAQIKHLKQSFFKKQFTEIDQFDGILEGIIKFDITRNKTLERADLNIKIPRGYFDFPDFFDKKINFERLNLSARILDNFNNININDLSADIDNSKFSASIDIDDFLHQNHQITTRINLQDVAVANLEQFWPKNLGEEPRKWVLEHFDGGDVKRAFAILNFKKTDGGYQFSDIKSELLLQNSNLDYSPHFPPIKNIYAIAFFDQNHMEVNIEKANLMDGIITKSKVIIPLL